MFIETETDNTTTFNSHVHKDRNRHLIHMFIKTETDNRTTFNSNVHKDRNRQQNNI